MTFDEIRYGTLARLYEWFSNDPWGKLENAGLSDLEIDQVAKRVAAGGSVLFAEKARASLVDGDLIESVVDGRGTFLYRPSLKGIIAIEGARSKPYPEGRDLIIMRTLEAIEKERQSGGYVSLQNKLSGNVVLPPDTAQGTLSVSDPTPPSATRAAGLASVGSLTMQGTASLSGQPPASPTDGTQTASFDGSINYDGSNTYGEDKVGTPTIIQRPPPDNRESTTGHQNSSASSEVIVQIPAADRFVTINHNSLEYRKTVQALDVLTEAVRGSNELFANPDDRLAVSVEISDLKQAISGASVRLSRIWAAAQASGVLGGLAREASSGAVRAAAALAIGGLLKLVGLV